MTSPLLTGLLLIIPCWLEPQLVNDKLQVTISSNGQIPIAVGAAGLVKVQYVNLTEDSLTISTPSVSPQCMFSAKCETSKGSLKGTSMGKVRFIPVKAGDGTQLEGIIVDPEIPMMLKAKKDFTFQVPVDTQWGGFFEPGVWDVSYKDTANKVHGKNPIRITSVYRLETVDLMLKRVKNKTTSRSFRNECAEWMLKVKPGTTLSFYLRTDTPEDQAEEDRQKDERIKEFEDWWKANRDTPEVRVRILDINEEYYIVDPMPDSKPKSAPSKVPGDKDPPASQAPKPPQEFKQENLFEPEATPKKPSAVVPRRKAK